MKNIKEVDRIEVLRCLIHPESDEDVNTEVLGCLLDKGYNGFVEICDFMADRGVTPQMVSCLVSDCMPQFFFKDSGEIIPLISSTLTKEVPA